MFGTRRRTNRRRSTRLILNYGLPDGYAPLPPALLTTTPQICNVFGVWSSALLGYQCNDASGDLTPIPDSDAKGTCELIGSDDFQAGQRAGRANRTSGTTDNDADD